MQKMHSPSADALAEMARHFRLPLLAYFRRRVRSPEDAEELTQEVFVRLLRRGNLAQITYLEGFAFMTAANLLKDYYRRSSRANVSATSENLLHQLRSEEPPPEKVTEDRQQLGVLMEALEQLPVKCRTVFIMHRFEDLSHTEIARRQGISVSAVEKHIAHAVLTLRTHLECRNHD